MKAYRLQRIGSIDGLELTDEATPTPGAGEVLLRVKANSLNFRDHAVLQGWMPFGVEAGRVPLSDAAGVVKAIGPNVGRFKVGDRALNSSMPDWFGGSLRTLPQQYGIHRDGWLAEYRVISEQELVAIPGFMSFEEAASLPCAAVTAWSALIGVGPGDTVLTQGSGGVSLFAIQLAKAAGAEVISTTSSDAKAARLLELGADHVINYQQDTAWGATVRSKTDGRGVDRVVEVGGPGTLDQSIQSVDVGGQISLVGVLAGGEQVDFMSMFISQARFQPIATGSRRDLEDMLRVIARHEIHPVIDSVFEFAAAKDAWAHFAARDLFGKVIIRQ